MNTLYKNSLWVRNILFTGNRWGMQTNGADLGFEVQMVTALAKTLKSTDFTNTTSIKINHALLTDNGLSALDLICQSIGEEWVTQNLVFVDNDSMKEMWLRIRGGYND